MCFHDELEWPENEGVGCYLERLVKKPDFLILPIKFDEMVQEPNPRVNRSDKQALRIAPSLYLLPSNLNGF